MDKSMSFVLKLPLKEMALRKVVVNLWNENDILTSIGKFQCDVFNGNQLKLDWQYDVENKVKDKASRLLLPELLKKRLMRVIRPIGLEIFKWIRYSCESLYLIYQLRYFSIRTLKQLHWTSAGAIDYQKTAGALISLNIFDVVKNYKLACEYCLVDELPHLWRKLNARDQKEFCEEENFWRNDVAYLEHYWSYFLKGEESKLYSSFSWNFMDFNQIAFETSVRTGNKVATKYFFPKLNNEERNASLFYAFTNAVRRSGKTNDIPKEMPEVLLYLFSQMSPEQQMQVLKEHTRGVLRFFLDWPLQDLYLDIADITRAFLSEESFYDLLHDTIEDAIDSGYYFPDLMQKCFLCCPADFRTKFINRFVSHFYKFEDIDIARIVFKSVDREIRMELLFRNLWFFLLLSDLILNDKWNVVEECIQEASLSEGDEKRLMQSLWKSLPFPEKAQKRISKRFVDFLDETDADARGKVENETVTTVKKLCTEDKKNNSS
ncbi:uncharacterized protein LOC129956925 [Argiope bruennichi]|uniref:uncharacterized protein LOC129956925 n=1 Tax=Argiope bruennichi TaxID=94029 RepID=UPI0024950F00|nr:uncharacterized protein LOC129956925 [Argiope bruennichi]